MMGTDPTGITRRRTVLAALMIAPAVVTALALIVVEGMRLRHPQAFLTARVSTLADAIERHDVRQAFDFIRAGEDPNTLVVVRHPVLTDGRERLASPLWWAVAVRDKQTVLMLLDAGARIERSENRDALCLAERLGDAGIADVLR